jgi:hypothetical protein
MSNFHTTLFKIVLYWCLDLIRHNIGTQLKLNKYISGVTGYVLNSPDTNGYVSYSFICCSIALYN